MAHDHRHDPAWWLPHPVTPSRPCAAATCIVPAPLESPVAKFLTATEQAALTERLSARPGDLLLIVADEWMTTCEVLGQLRNDIGRPPVHEGPYRYLWVVDFPLFVGVDEATGRPKPGHHPFCQPHPDDIDRLESDPMSARAQAYDLVLNGWELGGGSVRIHRQDVQSKVFRALNIGPEEAEAKFGFLLQALQFGYNQVQQQDSFLPPFA